MIQTNLVLDLKTIQDLKSQPVITQQPSIDSLSPSIQEKVKCECKQCLLGKRCRQKLRTNESSGSNNDFSNSQEDWDLQYERKNKGKKDNNRSFLQQNKQESQPRQFIPVFKCNNKIKKQQTRIVKDLKFLIDFPCFRVHPNISKRILQEGVGQPISQIKVSYDAFLSYKKYNFEGNLLASYKTCLKLKSNFSQKNANEITPMGLFLAMQTMKVKQKAWFVIYKKCLHMTQNLNHDGCHFEVTLQSIKYRDGLSFQSKKKVIQFKSQQAKELFQSGDYLNSFKKYKSVVYTCQGIGKKVYTKQQRKQFYKYGLIAKKNLIKCLAKLPKFHDSILFQNCQKWLKQILLQLGENEQTQFIKFHVQLRTRYLTDALQTAKKIYLTCPTQGIKLIELAKSKLNGNNEFY